MLFWHLMAWNKCQTLYRIASLHQSSASLMYTKNHVQDCQIWYTYINRYTSGMVALMPLPNTSIEKHQGLIAIQDIPKPIFNSVFFEILYIHDIHYSKPWQSFWKSALSMAVSLPCIVHNFKTIRENEILWALSLRWVWEGISYIARSEIAVWHLYLLMKYIMTDKLYWWYLGN